MSEEATEVSPHVADWTPAQAQLASLYGMCRTCGAPRATVTEPYGDGIRMSLACVNGHREPGV